MKVSNKASLKIVWKRKKAVSEASLLDQRLKNDLQAITTWKKVQKTVSSLQN
jgi:hypothetical protein